MSGPDHEPPWFSNDTHNIELALEDGSRRSWEFVACLMNVIQFVDG